jgi:hypothetical protein
MTNQSVYHGFEPTLGLVTRHWFLSEICSLQVENTCPTVLLCLLPSENQQATAGEYAAKVICRYFISMEMHLPWKVLLTTCCLATGACNIAPSLNPLVPSGFLCTNSFLLVGQKLLSAACAPTFLALMPSKSPVALLSQSDYSLHDFQR